MAKTFTIKSFADGQLAAAKATLYTCPALTETIIKTITLVNENAAAARTVNLYLKPSGSVSRRLIPVDLSLGAKEALIFDDEICMEAADEIEGDASVLNDVDYTISGVEET